MAQPSEGWPEHSFGHGLWRFSLTVNVVEFGGENGFPPERYWQHTDIIALFSECCKLLWRQNCLPPLERNFPEMSKHNHWSLSAHPVTRLILCAIYRSWCSLFPFLALPHCSKLSIKAKNPSKSITLISSSSTLFRDSRERYWWVVEQCFLSKCLIAAEYLARKYELWSVKLSNPRGEKTFLLL